MRLNTLYLRLSPNKFHYLKFILEGYDNLAVLSSFSHKDGIVVVRYPHSATGDLFSLLENIGGYLAQSG